MSNTPAKPDGTDPRVLAPPEDDELVTVSSSWGGSGEAYHTTRCRNVYRTEHTREVPLTIAEWKGYHECEACIEEGRYEPSQDDPTEDDYQRSPTAETCRVWRETVLTSDESPTTLAESSEWGATAIHSHVTGRCNHNDATHDDTHDHPPLACGWHADPSRDDSVNPDARDSNMHKRTCMAIRRRMMGGQSGPEVGDDLGMDKKTARRHATGDCQHAHDTLPALSYGWHLVDPDSERDST